jgi:esterase
MPEDKFIKVNGLRLHYRDFGNAGKPVALFMHGLTGNAYAFDHVAPDFVDTHHVLTLDFRGHGDSDWERSGDYDFRKILSDAFAFLAELGVARASLIGNSLGGIVAMVIAASKPELAERLVLNDIGPEINFAGQKEEEGPGLFDQDFESIEAALRCYRRTYPPARNLTDAVAAELVRNSTRLTGDGRLRWKTDPRVQAVAPRSDQPGPPPSLWPLFEAVKAPVLVIRGAESDALSPDTVSKMCARHPAAKAVEVPGVGHTPWLSEPEAMTALREFLRA